MKSFFYLADSVQQLLGGKTIVMGLYTDKVVLFEAPPGAPDPSDALPYGAPSLSLVFALAGLPAGRHEISVRLVGPDGNEYPGMQAAADLHASAEGSANLILNFTPFRVSAFGVFTLKVTILGTEFIETFEIRRRTIKG